MSIRRFGAQKKMKDSDKYYPGSPWGDKPPGEVSTLANPDPGTVLTFLRILSSKEMKDSFEQCL